MSEKNVLIDYRFDMPGQFDLGGHLLNSISQMAPQLDHIKSVGFNTITLALQVSIDLKTGGVNFGNPAGENLSMPPDTWKVVDYAHSIGLAVNLQLLPCVAFNADGTRNKSDENLNANVPLGPGVTFDKIFTNTIAPYDVVLARTAQQHHVEGIYIGANMYGLDDVSYLNLWKNVIDSIRSVYSGKIAYQAMWDNAVWSLTDTANYMIDPLISATPIYDLAQIVEGYYHTLDDGNVIQTIQSLIQKYGDSLILDGLHVQTANTGIGNNVVVPDLLYYGDLSKLSNLPTPNYREQALALQAYVYVAQHLLGDANNGLGIDGYAPWQQASWIQNPNSVTIEYWYQSFLLGWDLWGNASAESALKAAFTQDLLPNYFFSTPDNDSIVGKDGVINTAVFYGASSAATIAKNTLGVTVTSQLNGLDSLTNVQRLNFSDNSIALDIGPTQNAGSVYMIYKAAFNRAPDEGGMGYWLAQKDNGSNIVTNIAQGFVNAPEFVAKYGANPSNASYVDKLYQNVLGRQGEAGGVAYWNQELNAGNISKAAVLVQFATLAEGASLVADLIGNGIPYTEYLG